MRAAPAFPVIYTDLDGTLLDHETYSARKAEPLLKHLCQSGIPIVPCTSKTVPEILEIRSELGLDGAFVAENGASLHVPLSWPLRCPMGAKVVGTYWVWQFGIPRQAIEDAFEAMNLTRSFCFKRLTEMTAAEVADVTKLDEEDAERARQRAHSETVVWGDSSEHLAEFISLLTSAGFCVSRGGRFVHVMGPNDKAHAMNWLQAWIRKEWHGRPVSIAAGDAPNDREMLESADYALLMTPAHSPILKLNRTERLLISDGPGPGAWSAGIRYLLKQIDSQYGSLCHG